MLSDLGCSSKAVRAELLQSAGNLETYLCSLIYSEFLYALKQVPAKVISSVGKTALKSMSPSESLARVSVRDCFTILIALSFGRLRTISKQ